MANTKGSKLKLAPAQVDRHDDAELVPVATQAEALLDRAQDMSHSAKTLLDDLSGTGDESADKTHPRRAGLIGVLTDTHEHIVATQNLLAELRMYLIG